MKITVKNVNDVVYYAESHNGRHIIYEARGQVHAELCRCERAAVANKIVEGLRALEKKPDRVVYVEMTEAEAVALVNSSDCAHEFDKRLLEELA